MWYDIFSIFYDRFLEQLYRDSRAFAVSKLDCKPGDLVLDLPCGTGQSHEPILIQIGAAGRIIAVDRSRGMLRQSKKRQKAHAWQNIDHCQLDASEFDKRIIESIARRSTVDAIFCGLGLSAIPDWERVFDQLYEILVPHGRFVIFDVHAAETSRYSRSVELVARADLSRKCWQPLQKRTSDFEMETLSDDTKRFGGKLYVAAGTKER